MADKLFPLPGEYQYEVAQRLFAELNAEAARAEVGLFTGKEFFLVPDADGYTIPYSIKPAIRAV